MAADFKSHVLSRDEKGFGGIPFKRLLLGGVGGGFAYTLLRLISPGAAVPAGILVAVLSILLTSPRGGLPLWLRLWLRLRGALMLAGMKHPDGACVRSRAFAQCATRTGSTRWYTNVRATGRSGANRSPRMGDFRSIP